MPQRDPDSHKGQNGKVMVIGGSPQFHGAPILCALAAESSGVDMIFPFLPACHLEAAKTYSLNFILHSFHEDVLTSKDVKGLLNFSRKVDAVAIGPGLGTDPKTKAALKELLSELKTPTVIDADALLYTNELPETCVLTPHRGEFKELTGDEPTPENVQKWAKDMNAIILCKGPKDIIANKDELVINDTGTPLMTVGGTGDALTGVIAGLMAQGHDPFDACVLAAKIMGRTGQNIADMQGSLRAIDLVNALPSMLHSPEMQN